MKDPVVTTFATADPYTVPVIPDATTAALEAMEAALNTVLDSIDIIPVKNVDEVLKVALTKPLKRVEWVEVDPISSKKKSSRFI